MEEKTMKPEQKIFAIEALVTVSASRNIEAEDYEDAARKSKNMGTDAFVTCLSDGSGDASIRILSISRAN
jgi:hypothetical protein